MKLLWLVSSFALLEKANAFVAPVSQKLVSPRPETSRQASGVEEFVSEKVAGLTSTISAVPGSAELQNALSDASQSILHALPDGVDETYLQQLFTAATKPYHLGAIGLFALASSILLFINSPEDFSDAPFEPGTNTYDPKASDAFYRQRPLMVLKRLLKLATLTGSFNTGILFDWLVLGKLLKDEEYTALKKAEPRRAKQSLVLCEQLGPTFIST